MSKRPIKSIAVPGIEPSSIDQPEPVFDRIDPRELLVDEAYQRNLSERSVTLIRKIVGAWDWRKFKPPVVARTDSGLEVIDGQHTAIAAATHPGIATIPIMIVDAPEQGDRAKAFIGHNRDRINITPMQMHFAAVAAGDEDALTTAQVCERAGVHILKAPPGNGAYKPGDAISVRSIGALINRRGAMRARQILQALVEARCAPVSAGLIKAVEMLAFDPEYEGQVELSDVTSALLADPAGVEKEAEVFAAAHGVRLWKALGIVLFKRSRRGRRRAA